MKKIVSILISLFLIGSVAQSCSKDNDKGEVSLSNIDPVEQLEVSSSNREKELVVNFLRKTYVKDLQIEIAFRKVDAESVQKWNIVLLDGNDSNYKNGVNYLLKVPSEGTYEVAVTLVGANGLRSESKSQKATTFEYAQMKMFDCAHSMMTNVMEYYYHKGPRTCWQTWYPKVDGFWDGDALVWGQGSGLSAFVAMREASLGTGQERYYESLDNDMFSGIQAFWVADRGRTAYSVYPAAGNERFYDDNVWIGLDMAEWYNITKDKRYLDQAKAVWSYLAQYGWDDTCGGGVHWKELNEPSKSKNTCSTAPTGVLSCILYQLTNEQIYLDKAKECFNWLQTYMYDSSDHLYYDNASPKDEDPTQVGYIEKNKFSYNSGQPLQLACLLYKITHEDYYLNIAKQIAEACYNKWFKQFHSDILQRDIRILSPGHAWFNTIMCRGFFELYSIDENPLYLKDIHDTMLHAWFGKAHHSNGLINNEDLSGLSGDIPAEDGGNKWQILHQGALVELYARLAVLEKQQK